MEIVLEVVLCIFGLFIQASLRNCVCVCVCVCVGFIVLVGLCITALTYVSSILHAYPIYV